MVAVPAVIQAGSEAKLCASLLQPNETLVMTVSLMADGQNKRLLHQSSDQEFHRCFQFQVSPALSDKVQNFKVEVRGETFLSTEERRVMIKPYSPMTFIQTDKPIYNPGQTVLFRVVTLDSNFSPVNQLDVNHNRIGQWVNTTSSGNILQLSHPLNSEAPVGSFTIVVWIGEEKIYHNFKVEQYVLPKFEIKMNLTDKISVVQEECEVKVCAEYTYGQPVPGKAGVKLCRPLDNAVIPITIDARNPQGVPDYTPPCHKESIEVLTCSCVAVAEGDVTLTLAVVPEMAPVVQLLVYSMLPSETVIAHSMNFPTEKCFRNKVCGGFSPSNAVPGEENTLRLSARPGSLCGLSAVDQSVGIMEPGKRLDADKVTRLTEVNNSGTTIPAGNTTSDYSRHGVDLFTVIKLAYSLMARPGSAGPRLEMAVAGGLAAPPPPPIQTVRTFFPETWIWDLVEVGESGSLDVPLTVPDTITTWETEVFCLAPSGFGLAPLVELTVFQPFFLELTLPYSVIRGERFELKATVFNYLSKCIMVSVTPALSSDYTLTPLRDVQDSSCLCANGRKTFSWTMAPSVLGVLNVSVSAEAVRSQTACDNGVVNVPERGRVDTVTRSLLVKAEGTEKSHTYNWLLCPTGEALTEEVEVQLPQNVVDGSARISLSVLGDILGRALNNLDGLLQMPYGCGEQNMALNTEQLTPAILEKATKFLTSGYQRQLNYKNADGAYSTFGQGLGNTWLTAFVLRSFGKAQSFIYVDPATMEQSKTWLERQQGQHGCFRTLGKLLNNRMKGGVTDEVTLTAYITASMLELNMSVTVSSFTPWNHFSHRHYRNLIQPPSLFWLCVCAPQPSGGLLHWSQSSSETSPSLEVEISSYVLLASLSASSRSTSDLGYASRIVRWLVRQQNAYGGFSSTQDTVVALQALALYSTRVFSRGGASTVTLRSPSGDRCLFHVNQNNKLLYQERALQDTEGKYSVEVQGSACASVQVSEYTSLLQSCGARCTLIHITGELFVLAHKMFLTSLPFRITLDIIQELPVQNLKPAVVKIYDYYQPSKLLY
uniref:Alpha-2-macroglobulin-like n=1 Tax=Oncorhynchus tshawytscha TaxID=74940 RepID=A0AAZ3SNF4_ONCTS